MKLEDVIKALREGRKIRREIQDDTEYLMIGVDAFGEECVLDEDNYAVEISICDIGDLDGWAICEEERS